jgi:hypothetical protein
MGEPEPSIANARMPRRELPTSQNRAREYLDRRTNLRQALLLQPGTGLLLVPVATKVSNELGQTFEECDR